MGPSRSWQIGGSRYRSISGSSRGRQPRRLYGHKRNRVARFVDDSVVLGRLFVPLWPDYWSADSRFCAELRSFPISRCSFHGRLMKFLMERSPTMQISCIVCGRVRMMPLCWSSQGFCSQPVKKPELLLAVLKGRRFRLIPRCAVTQANSKQRIIDDAARGGQSDLSSDQSKLVLCTPLRPAQHIAAVASVMSEDLWAHSCRSDPWLGAGEDWPQAYRHSPINFDESLACVVIFWHDEWQEPAFQVYSSLLFGLPLAVTPFNRYSRFAEALGRRLQRSFGMLKELLGKPFCETAAVG